MKILIHQDATIPEHTGSWVKFWKNYLNEKNIPYTDVDLFKVDAVEAIKGADVLLWHFNNYCYEEMLEARSILNVAEMLGVKTFPSFQDAWHFDDKVAEMYALQAAGASIPKSYVFYDLKTLRQALHDGKISFPIVAKLRTGSGAHNVKKITSARMLIRYARRMFGKGFSPHPSLFYKASSNVRSAHTKKDFMTKFRRIPEFLRTLKGARKFPHEKGYVYLQEFIPNDGYDIKVVVIGDKLAGFNRPVRSHDFRASGGGAFRHDKELFTESVIKCAFEAADKLHVQCIGFDFVVDRETQKPYIVEMSYGFSNQGVLGMKGYFDRNCVWHDEPLDAAAEVLKNILPQG